MKTLFEGSTYFDLVSLWDLGSRYLSHGPEQIRVIGFQRNAVWKEEKVEALWDSFLSGFPVGSIILARQIDYWQGGTRKAQLFRTNHSEDTIIDQQGEGFVIVDGQQRLNGIAQGFMSFDKSLSHARLWIDLARPANPDQCQYEFFLCTSNNPFGVNGPIALTRDEWRNALASVNAENLDESELNLMDTYPYRAKLPVPFYEFWQFIESQLVNKGKSKSFNEFATFFDKVDWHLSDDVLKLLHNQFSRFKIRDIDHDLLEPLKKTVFNRDDDDNYRIPVILVPKIDPKRLGKLFERVNISGEVPSQAELFFSALKLRFPLINNYVADVSNDSELNGLLTPTEIVLMAIRLIDPDITSLELSRFERLVKKYGPRLIRLMESGSGKQSHFMQCFKLIYQALHYDEKNNPKGLPRLLLESLRPRVWHTVAIWVNTNYEEINKGCIHPGDRLNMIRFALLDALNYLIDWDRGLATYIQSSSFINLPIKPVLTKKRFPSLEIYKSIKEKVEQDRYFLRFSKPLSYYSWLRQDTSPTFTYENELSNEKIILMYCQRHYLSIWERSYLHLDIDHIVPSDWMVLRAGSRPATDLWKVKGVPIYTRYDVLHRTGNYRYWPNSLNRAYHDKAPNDKYIYSQLDDETDPEHERLGLPTVEDVLAASLISPEDAKGWEELCTENPKYWTGKRFFRFKQLVTKRRYQMYKQLFEAMKWDDWIEKMNA